MNKRKETPDLLSEILGGDVSPTETAGSPTPSPAKPKRASKPRQPSTSQPRPELPTRWDYQVVSFQYHHGWRPRFVNGAELTDWTGWTFIQAVHRQQRRGWLGIDGCHAPV